MLLLSAPNRNFILHGTLSLLFFIQKKLHHSHKNTSFLWEISEYPKPLRLRFTTSLPRNIRPATRQQFPASVSPLYPKRCEYPSLAKTSAENLLYGCAASSAQAPLLTRFFACGLYH
ncbi:MAG: hypothetical protein QM689_11010 [Oscillospiraceae bacterium]